MPKIIFGIPTLIRGIFLNQGVLGSIGTMLYLKPCCNYADFYTMSLSELQGYQQPGLRGGRHAAAGLLRAVAPRSRGPGTGWHSLFVQPIQSCSQSLRDLPPVQLLFQQKRSKYWLLVTFGRSARFRDWQGVLSRGLIRWSLSEVGGFGKRGYPTCSKTSPDFFCVPSDATPSC